MSTRIILGVKTAGA